MNMYIMYILGGGFKQFLFSRLPWEMIQFDEHIFQMGWFNHQLVYISIYDYIIILFAQVL